MKKFIYSNEHHSVRVSSIHNLKLAYSSFGNYEKTIEYNEETTEN